VVDSSHDPFTGKQLGGKFVLHSWVNDVKPPKVQLVTATVAAGRPSIVARVTDSGSGVDPLSLLLDTKQQQVGATMYDPQTGIAVFPIPRSARPVLPGSVFMRVIASDYQEAKNAYVKGDNLLPNSTFETVELNVVSRPTVSWLSPAARACVSRRTQLTVVANGKSRVSSVIFMDGSRRIARVKRNTFGIYRATWQTGGAHAGAHVLTAVVADESGRQSQATRTVRVCR